MKVLQPKTNMAVYSLRVSTLETLCIYSIRSRIRCEVIILTQKGLLIYLLFKRKARHMGEYLVIYVYLRANWNGNWGTEGSEVAANTEHCESTKGLCLQSHSVLVCKRWALYCSAGLQLDGPSVSVFLCVHTNLALFLSCMEFRGLLHASISIANWFTRACLHSEWRPNGHQICCHSSSGLNFIWWKRI